MAKINRTGGAGGAWLDKSQLNNGDVLKLVSEAMEIESQHGPQLVAKCRVKGHAGEAVNVAINGASRNALIDAFGDDSKLWVDKLLTVDVEKGTNGGKRTYTLRLVPEGFSIETDSEGYVVITRDPVDRDSAVAPYPAKSADTEITPEDIPF